MLTREIIEEAPGDWSVIVAGEFIGYARTWQEATRKANTYAYSLLSKQQHDDVLDDPFGANKAQSALAMTVLCPECCGDTYTILTIHGDYRKCAANAAHQRVRVL